MYDFYLTQMPLLNPSRGSLCGYGIFILLLCSMPDYFTYYYLSQMPDDTTDKRVH